MRLPEIKLFEIVKFESKYIFLQENKFQHVREKWRPWFFGLNRKLAEMYDRKCQDNGYIKWKYQITVKHYFKEENEVNENKILS